MEKNKNFGAIPIVDLQGLNFSDPPQLANQLRDICHHIGFFVVVNHTL